jgi:hypothetical protein
MYTYFSSSFKKHLEHGTFAKLLETKGLKLICNVKTRWISMLSLAKRILAEYKTLVVKMHDDLHIVATTKTNLQYLCDIEVVMGLACIMLLLESIHVLIKFVQACDTFVFDFVIIVKMCCVELYIMYSNLEKKYGVKYFKAFLDLHENNND